MFYGKTIFSDLFAQYLKRFEREEYPCALLRLCAEQSKPPEL